MGVDAWTSTEWDDDEIKKKDQEFAERMKSRSKYITEEEYAEFLRRHLAEVDELRRKKLADKRRLDARLQDKLQQRKGARAQVRILVSLESCFIWYILIVLILGVTNN